MFIHGAFHCSNAVNGWWSIGTWSNGPHPMLLSASYSTRVSTPTTAISGLILYVDGFIHILYMYMFYT